ncbi:tRNA(m1G37)methyltransferase [Latilactobacillus curvatus]|uniref:tRNA (guanosine(37)-N1)-methyltransferase TrmD n=1 Tax=Latilactobacillus curvatus TaxID=28038 RepID=UPI0009776510|nr:tRNA (guanosine(37)-N1)-methyltransferase TrmD [Latilactobacillus curvatus]AZP96115.1 tRNA (guanosine(37)-N1)-methyltransferase TrmD [Latilactobacillus curvatus]UTC08603.1 tRNA (guanosine(37)-N1)-methyltransferase TrmD [Latilactobacillus curvatus]SMH68224.1 tRNA(m1G37)methyltransferase [Latilactobacillus curvatus]
MKIDVLSLFPDMVQNGLSQSIIGKAIDRDLIDLEVTDFRDFSVNKHNSVDDAPYGGGAGMLLRPQPIFEAMDQVNAKNPRHKRVILLDPAGVTFNQKVAEEFAQEDHLVFICGHYEGYDERIRTLVTDEVSLGDFVVTGGELGAMVMIDAISRLVPGVLGNEQSAVTDSFSTGLLEHPQYTRPPEYRGLKVPEVLMKGNHKLINEWREKMSLKRTYERRPDLLEKMTLTKDQLHWLQEIKQEAAEK